MYKIKLTNKQIQTIYKITDNKDKQSKLMSILSYIIKYTENNKLTKSLNKLYNMYIRLEYRKITRSYFYTLVDLLKDFKLVVDKIEDTLQDKTNVAESVENTDVDNDLEKHNDLIINNTYTYTLNTSSNVKVSALDLCEEVFKDLKIKSNIIKQMVISKLQNTVLDGVGAINYIIRVITEKTEQYNAMRVNYAKAVANTKYSKTKNTYSGTGRTFNNFEGREYDYDSLEKKLLGWDND
jgi:hypothetical protein